jgi:uncharacterized membrane protein
LAICAAWYSTIAVTRCIARLGASRPVGTAVFAGVLTLAYDIALEPMASRVTMYWIWDNGDVPIQNYLSWFATAFAAVYFFERFRPPGYAAARVQAVRTSLLIYLLHLGLFITVNLTNGYFTESLIAASLAGLTLYRAFHSARDWSPRVGQTYGP